MFSDVVTSEAFAFAFKNPLGSVFVYLYDHPAGDKEVGGGERRPEKGSHHEVENNAENKILNRFEIKSFNGIRGVF